MKWIFSLIFILSFLFNMPGLSAQETDFLLDERDGNIYLVKKFHWHWWMCQNLKYDIGEGSSCYQADDNNCLLKGRWYTFEAAQKACPEGYRLPSDEDWKKFESFLGMHKSELDKKYNRNSGNLGKLLKSGGNAGFDADYSGMVHPMGKDDYMGTRAFFWTATEESEKNGWARSMMETKAGIDRQIVAKDYGLNIRCIKDAEVEQAEEKEESQEKDK